MGNVALKDLIVARLTIIFFKVWCGRGDYNCEPGNRSSGFISCDSVAYTMCYDWRVPLVVLYGIEFVFAVCKTN